MRRAVVPLFLSLSILSAGALPAQIEEEDLEQPVEEESPEAQEAQEAQEEQETEEAQEAQGAPRETPEAPGAPEEIEAPPPGREAGPEQPPRERRFALEAEAEEQYLQGNLDEAAGIYEELGRILDDLDLKLKFWTTAAWLYQEIGRPIEARAVLQEGLRIHPEYQLPAARFPQPFVELYRDVEGRIDRERLLRVAELVHEGVSRIEEGAWEEARRALERGLEIAPDHPTALYNRALVDLQTGRDEEAITTFERLVTLDTRREETLSDSLRGRVEASLGLLYLRRDFVEDARRHLRQAVDLRPEDASTWNNLGLALRKLDRGADAREAFSRAHELAPEDSEAANNLASSFLRQGDADRAAEILREATADHPDRPALWLNLGLAERERGQRDRAREAFEEVLSLDEDNARGLAARAATYLTINEYEAGRFPACEAAAARAVELDPEAVEAWIYKGLAEQEMNDVVSAQRSLRRALEIDPLRPEVHNNLGTILVTLGDYEGAIEAFQRALEIDPEFAAARANLGQVRSALEARRAPEEERGRSRRRTKELGIRFDTTDFSYLGIEGAIVDSVKSRSPAARGGLQEGDIILGVDGRKIEGPRGFLEYVHEEATGDTVQVDVLRDNRPRRLVIEIR